MNKFQKFVMDPAYRMRSLSRHGVLNIITDETYLKIMFQKSLHKKLNLEMPLTFNEKMQWLKLYDRKPLYTDMVDKLKAKEYVAEKIGRNYIIPTLKVWNSPDEIKFNDLPNQFVIKCNHNSGGLYICRDKDKLNEQAVVKGIRKGYKQNYYYSCREWPYKNVFRKIFAEKYCQNHDNEYLPVFKFFCFNGVPKIIQVIQNDKQIDETIDYYDIDWHLLELHQNYPNSEEHIPKPDKLDEMISVARNLSEDIAFLRVDLYYINGGGILFGIYILFRRRI